VTAASSTTRLTIGDWQADRTTGRLVRGADERPVEPKVMDLLFLLASRPGGVFPKPEIAAALWPGVTVGDDSLSRCVFKLRRALDDDPRAPRYIETIPKRGYRLLLSPRETPGDAPVAPPPPGDRPRRGWLIAGASVLATALLIATGWSLASRSTGPSDAALTQQADDFYFQMTRADNEAAIALYERTLAQHPRAARARSGLANALVQQALRWQGPPGLQDRRSTNLAEALADGRLKTSTARAQLARAMALAEAATREAPNDPAAWKALGFVRSATGDIGGGMDAHRRAVALDPDAWDALMNLADLSDISGSREAALDYLERSYAAMTRVSSTQAPRVRPWRADTGVLIADRHAASGRAAQAEQWYRQVLAYAPLHPGATAGLARLLAESGDAAGAHRLCRELVERTGPQPACRPFAPAR